MTSDGTNTYTWDARNQLNSISGILTASFEYDPFGRRLQKTVNSTTTDFLYDSVNPVQELSGTTVTANVLTGLGVDEYRSGVTTAAFPSGPSCQTREGPSRFGFSVLGGAGQRGLSGGATARGTARASSYGFAPSGSHSETSSVMGRVSFCQIALPLR